MDEAEAILAFWFGTEPLTPATVNQRSEVWFGSVAAFDAEIRDRFAPAIERAARRELDAWAATPRSALARVVLLDQLPRNAFRGTARAFALDPLALEAARGAVDAGHLQRLAPVEQAFLILPFEHSEALADQHRSVALQREIVAAATPAWRPFLETSLRFAEDHLALIERFGRFPHRNRVLGRPSTAEETAFLAGGGATFGQG